MNMQVKPPKKKGLWVPPDYEAHFRWRIEQCARMQVDSTFAFGAFEHYRTRPVEFIMHWCDTVDPRNAGQAITRMPFILYESQQRAVQFLLACLINQNSGLIEKSRDVGMTWVCCAFSVWLWLYWDGSAVGWGSRKEDLVDRIGDMSSIFEKIRTIIRGLPLYFLPEGFNLDKHMSFMRIRNPANGAQITGESGDDIGRGGRSLIYFKDESAHYEHPELVEAALSENTRVQIDLSSVSGPGNVFARKREAGIEWAADKAMRKGPTWVFVVDWSDNPQHTPEWYKTRRAKFESEGLLHVFKQEVDRNYSASVDNNIIELDWIKAAIDSDQKLKLDMGGPASAALDVADEGGDLNALSVREGVVLVELDEWGERDPGFSTRRTINMLRDYCPIAVQYDSIGVGVSVKVEYNRLRNEINERGKPLLPAGLRFVPWDASAKVINPKVHMIRGDSSSPLNDDFFHNFKAQAWWDLRLRFYRTWRAVNEGLTYPADQLICIRSDVPYLRKLEKELTQVTYGPSARLKTLIEKKPNGAKSPNLADSVMMNYFPVRTRYNYDTSMRWVQ